MNARKGSRQRTRGGAVFAGGVAAAAIACLASGCALILGNEPNAPVGVILQQLSSGEVRVEWVDASSGGRSETGFRIERRIDAELEYAERATIDANETSFDDDSALPGLTYWYRVAAFNDEFDSGPSAPAQITTADHSGSSGSSLGNVTGSGMLVAGTSAQVLVAGDMLIDTYVATSSDTSVEGDWNVANFTNNSGSVWFQNADTTSTIYGFNSWHQLLSDTPGKTILFEAGETQQVTSTLGFVGIEGERVTLLSTVSGVRWTIDNLATSLFVEYVVVKDSEVASNQIVADNSLDAGNNDVGGGDSWVFQ